ncbi:DUF421 domain-containing protein [Desmospora activa]|uniref:Uncharacterized membrane protein YcaP (DUF421 family) n=1 Tax=Desmospora activa DSM 45169 TaxID=1121389 RepID=A0A2T4Z8X4_9BACL|nr:DUF421 domain-containing protein [Desmospora activa]PTM58329.1 uncharacterized membrane protein YcaP (DUF421 family) [Desmospora activa DSM 45169]
MWTIFLRSVFIYFFVLLVMRLMGKREIGKLSVFDLVVSIMIADFAVISIDNTKIPLMHGVIPIVTMLGAQVLLAWVTLKSPRIRDVVDGKPSMLIKNGKIQEQEMRKQRYNVEDLMVQLRDKRIHNLADVEFAILEPSGKLSVFPKEERMPVTKGDLFDKVDRLTRLPVPVVVDGQVQKDALKKLGQDQDWLKKRLHQYGHKDISEIFFASVDHHGSFYIDSRQH